MARRKRCQIHAPDEMKNCRSCPVAGACRHSTGLRLLRPHSICSRPLLLSCMTSLGDKRPEQTEVQTVRGRLKKEPGKGRRYVQNGHPSKRREKRVKEKAGPCRTGFQLCHSILYYATLCRTMQCHKCDILPFRLLHDVHVVSRFAIIYLSVLFYKAICNYL